MRFTYQPIGTIYTPFAETEGMPIQSALAAGTRGQVDVLPEFAEGLKDLDGFSHIILLYHFHRCTGSRLIVTPFLDDRPRGVFATRAPVRPNPIGLSIVKLLSVHQNILQVANVDMLDATPQLDIKPYVPQFDHCDAPRTGWMEKASKGESEMKSDDRFSC